jgi:hypothetical protein
MARAISQRCSEQPANASAFAKSSPGDTVKHLAADMIEGPAELINANVVGASRAVMRADLGDR